MNLKAFMNIYMYTIIYFNISNPTDLSMKIHLYAQFC